MDQMEASAVSKNQGLAGVVTLGEWMVTLLISAIPIVNIIMFFVWAFGANTKYSKANWAKATLIWIAIGIVFYIVVIVMILGGLAAFTSFFKGD